MDEEADGASERFEDWAKEWLETSIHLKPRTRVDYEGVLRTRLNPCIGVRMPRMVRREMLFLNAGQVLTLSRAIEQPFGPMILFAAYTGTRAGEIGALRVRRGDLEKARVEIRESLADVNGQMIVGPTKTYESRTLALPPFLVEALAEHIDRQGAEGDDLVFTSRRGRPLRRNVFMVRYYKAAVVRAGLPVGLRFHDLRHTCVALLVAQGPRAIMERLGHSTIEVTLGRYGHVLPSLDAGLVDGLQRTFEEANQLQRG